jgi:Fe2+ transport system protein FeoA
MIHHQKSHFAALPDAASQLDPDLNNFMTLSIAPLNVPLIVESIDSGRDARSRLTSLGILPGMEITILTRDHDGPMTLTVKGTKIALGRGISGKVLVSVNQDLHKE